MIEYEGEESVRILSEVHKREVKEANYHEAESVRSEMQRERGKIKSVTNVILEKGIKMKKKENERK